MAIVIVLAVVLITGLLGCLRLASIADDEFEQMMSRDKSE